MILFCSAGYVETVYSCDCAIGLPDFFLKLENLFTSSVHSSLFKKGSAP
jgi:hypothetical protein